MSGSHRRTRGRSWSSFSAVSSRDCARRTRACEPRTTGSGIAEDYSCALCILPSNFDCCCTTYPRDPLCLAKPTRVRRGRLSKGWRFHALPKERLCRSVPKPSLRQPQPPSSSDKVRRSERDQGQACATCSRDLSSFLPRRALSQLPHLPLSHFSRATKSKCETPPRPPHARSLERS